VDRQRLQLEVAPSEALHDQLRDEIIALCTRAYEEDFADLIATFPGAVHVLGWLDSRLVSHALWIERSLQASDGPLMHTAYVEAVATHPEFRNRGFAAAVMQRVADEIHAYDLGSLSPFSVAYYARLGWERWRGPLYVRTDQGLERSPDEETVMILRLPKTPRLDLAAPLSVEWRAGEIW
jgi:aminoglycoside 2'-N-acetyltransferase I